MSRPVAGAALLALLASCADDPSVLLRANFPDQAAQVLGEGQPEALSEAAEGFALARGHQGLSLELSRRGVASFFLPDGFRVEVTERGARGEARLHSGAVAFQNERGYSYWSATAHGFEEWLLIEASAAGAVAQWELSAGTFRQAGQVVEVVDGAGVARLRVSAPVAYARGGEPAEVHLIAQGSRLSLHAKGEGPLLVDPSWVPINALVTARARATTTLLPTGKVLVAGGMDVQNQPLASTELFDPFTGQWSLGAPMGQARMTHSATVLPNGKVLVVGGSINNCESALNHAELYDPLSGQWSPTANLPGPRCLHSANLLETGRVLISGGWNGSGTAHHVIYVPGSNSFEVPSSLMVTPRAGHTANRMPGGKVVVAGGAAADGGVLLSTEIFDPAQGTWSAGTPLGGSRYLHNATVMADGKLLVAFGASTSLLNRVLLSELWQPGTPSAPLTNTYGLSGLEGSSTLLPSGRVLMGGDSSGELAGATFQGSNLVSLPAQGSALLSSGQVLLLGGLSAGTASPSGTPSADVQLYDPAAPSWTTSSAVSMVRRRHTLTTLSTGRALVVGGINGTTLVVSTEVYDPPTRSFTLLPNGSLAQPRTDHTATRLAVGTDEVLVVGGRNAGPLAHTERFRNGSWSDAGTLATGRLGHTATLLGDGRVAVIGGTDGGTELDLIELYHPPSSTWSPGGQLRKARMNHTSTLLPSGVVLIAGGSAGGAPLSDMELFDPSSGASSSGATMKTPRERHTATLLPSGEVLLVGGMDLAVSPDKLAETFHPTSSIARLLGSAAPRQAHSAVLLPSGRVLLMGGLVGDIESSGAELFDPATSQFSQIDSIPGGLTGTPAARLGDGTVLISAPSTNVAATATSAILSEVDLPDAGWPLSMATLPSLRIGASTLPVTGTGFMTLPEAHGGTSLSSATNFPIFTLERQDNGQRAIVPAFSWDGGEATVGVPPGLPLGPYFSWVTVNGVSAHAPRSISAIPQNGQVVVTPAEASLDAGRSLQFSASGGAGSGYRWRFASNQSSATLNPQTGAYVAGPLGGGDVVRAQDPMGAFGDAQVSVQPELGWTLEFPPSIPPLTAGKPIDPALQVILRDADGSMATDLIAQVSLRLAASPDGGTLLGPTKQLTDGGMATFSNLSIEQAGTGYRLRASTGGLSKVSSSFEVLANPADHLHLEQQPVTGIAGQPLDRLRVMAVDYLDNLDRSFGGRIAVSIVPDAGLLGTLELSADGGLADFDDLVISEPGTYTLIASADVADLQRIEGSPLVIGLGQPIAQVTVQLRWAEGSGEVVGTAWRATAEITNGSPDEISGLRLKVSGQGATVDEVSGLGVPLQNSSERYLLPELSANQTHAITLSGRLTGPAGQEAQLEVLVEDAAGRVVAGPSQRSVTTRPVSLGVGGCNCNSASGALAPAALLLLLHGRRRRTR